MQLHKLFAPAGHVTQKPKINTYFVQIHLCTFNYTIIQNATFSNDVCFHNSLPLLFANIGSFYLRQHLYLSGNGLSKYIVGSETSKT